MFQSRDWDWLSLIARLKPGATPRAATVDVQTIAARLQRYPENIPLKNRLVFSVVWSRVAHSTLLPGQ